MKERKIKKIWIVIVALLVLGMLGGICLIYGAKSKGPDHIVRTKQAAYWKLEDGTLEFWRYTGDDLNITIPEKVKGMTVSRIFIQCLRGENRIYPRSGYQIHIPDTVTVIEREAFRDCLDLTITGAKGVEEIGEGAFAYCSFAAPLPDFENLKTVDSYAFGWTKNIGELKLNEQVERIEEYAFFESEIEQIEISPNVAYIGNSAFEGTKWLEAQEGYLTVGQDILIKFPDEETVVIPEGVRTVSMSGVEDYKKVKNIYIAPSVQTIYAPILAAEKAGDTAELNLYIPASIDTIEGKLVWNGEENVTLIVEEGSYAEEYARQAAEKYGYQYQVVDKIEYPE